MKLFTVFHWSVLFGIALTIIVLDQLTKSLVVANLSLYERWIPIDALSRFFSITYTRNTGAAFGFFQSGSLFFLSLAVIASAAIIYYYRQLPVSAGLVRIALGLQLGGAVGNAVDRIFRGYVVDFIHVYYEPHFDWPIFNIADSSIVIGVLLLVVILWNSEEEPENQPQEDYSSSQ